MATTTSNLGLTKPSYSDTADIATINGNMDILDQSVNAVENGIAIIANGNSHSALSTGDFVYVRKHGTLAEGLYKALSNIAANATLTSSNLSSVSGGLGAEVSSLNSNLTALSNKVENIKRIISAESSGAVASGAYAEIQTITLPAGEYIVFAYVETPSVNDNAVLAVKFGNNIAGYVKGPAYGGSYMNFAMPTGILSSTTIIHLLIYNPAGGNCSWKLSAVRLGA